MNPVLSRLHGNVSREAEKNITEWLTKPKYQQYVGEIEQLIENEEWKQLEDAFFKVIEFGTAGRRGTTGVGSNRINEVTIGESAQALCSYITSLDATAVDKGIVIAYDTRLTSKELSEYAARVCAANGFRVYLFDDYRSTPELSFAVRYLKAAAGIVISASHNPPQDNGFKACWSDGGQLVAPHDKGVLAEAERIDEIRVADYESSVRDDRIVIIGDGIDKEYVQAAVAESENNARELNIVYSPLHGAGQTNVLPVLHEAGFDGIDIVGEQMIPDGNFPTISTRKPNPEEKPANDMAVQRLLDTRADIAITNDPDADRFGVIVRVGNDPIYLTGNQAAALAADYVLRKKSDKGELTPLHFITKTIVTTDLLNALADRYNVRMYDNLLIGFKYIGELILKKEATSERFLLGGEESFGMLKGDYVRDKDGASGSLMLAEYAAELKTQNKTLYERLGELFVEYGVYAETLANVQLPGADGFSEMQRIMHTLRSDTPMVIAGREVSAVTDYKMLARRDIATAQVETIAAVAGDVIVFEFGDSRRRVTIRPSGTEPKLKLYIQWFDEVKGGNAHDAHRQYDQLIADLNEFARALETQITT